jgi:hypothetical protein
MGVQSVSTLATDCSGLQSTFMQLFRALGLHVPNRNYPHRFRFGYS